MPVPQIAEETVEAVRVVQRERVQQGTAHKIEVAPQSPEKTVGTVRKVQRERSTHIERVVNHCFPDQRKTAQILTSPGSKHVGKSAENAADDPERERRKGYRSIAPTADYVAADRPDLQYTTSVLMRTPETPLEL